MGYDLFPFMKKGGQQKCLDKALPSLPLQDLLLSVTSNRISHDVNDDNGLFFSVVTDKSILTHFSPMFHFYTL